MTMSVADLNQLQDLIKDFIEERPCAVTSTSVATLQTRIRGAINAATLTTFTVTGPLATESGTLDGIESLLRDRGYNIKVVSSAW